MNAYIETHWVNFVLLFLVSWATGYLEQHVYRHGYEDNGSHWFGWLNPRHHVPMIVGISLACGAAGSWWFTPAFLVFEDMFYHAHHPGQQLGPDTWIARPMGGLWLGPLFVPWLYVVGLVLSGILLLVVRG